MGSITIHAEVPYPRAELGYWTGVPYWGQGYMTEAVRAVIAFGFDTLGLHRIQATAYPRNVGSWRVMEKAGMTYEGTLREFYVKNGVPEDARMYAVLRSDDWRASDHPASMKESDTR
jgi:RimJ/RimL family protein N-acetyltransferase